VSVTPTTGNATALNSQCTGGTVSTLVDGTTTDITGKRCGAASNATEPSAGTVGYNFYTLVTTTTPNTFTLGSGYSNATVATDNLGAATAAAIPTTADTSTVFSKQ
jgi:hypothetical protein